MSTGPTATRYLTAVALGTGATAEVFRAHDTLRGCDVALKFLRHDDPDLIARMAREARAQARLDHPSICRIFEVGALDGRPFIAMQYVDGEELDVAARGMTPEQKARVIWQVAEAIQVAHAEGVVHRDLKPANIMVERRGDGGLHPVIVDFGLALEPREETLTRAGDLLGTLAYMAPEQIGGPRSRVDRRADVYALGATLYHLLVGHPPFVDGQGVDLLMQVAHAEPPPPRRLDASIPEALETIVLACLEKEPQRRYASAAALAADLRRFLDVEPILARRPGLGARLGRSIRRHKVRSLLVAVAVVAVLAAAVLVERSRWRADRRAIYEQRFTRLGQDAAWRLRVEHMSAAHDIRPAKAGILRRMAEIRRTLDGAGELAEGPARYALGRAHLLLGEHLAAAEHLEAAWDLGYRTPDAAAALGLALSRRYQRERERILTRIPLVDQGPLLERIGRQFRDPALEALRRGRSAESLSVDYVEGLIAWMEQRHDAALLHAAAALAGRPWLYEAVLLRGDVHLQVALEALATGRLEPARRALDEAEAAFRDAVERAGSDPRARVGLCRSAGARLRIGGLSLGRAAHHLRVAEAACADAEALDAGLAESAAGRAEANLSYARLAMRLVEPARGGAAAASASDPEAATAAAEAAVARAPGDAAPYRLLGEVQLIVAEAHLFDREEGAATPALEKALRTFNRALEIEPAESTLLNSLGGAHNLVADVRRRRGLGSQAASRAAIDALERAVAIQPESFASHSNLADSLLELAFELHSTGEPFAAEVERALDRARTARALNPEHLWTRGLVAQALLFRARAAVAARGDPRPAVDEMLAEAEDAVSASGGMPELRFLYGLLLADAAIIEMQLGGDPTSHLEACGGLLAQF
ncbi:MAG: serine/threonine-protein kinase, partial [Acidobacteriota bacterium]